MMLSKARYFSDIGRADSPFRHPSNNPLPLKMQLSVSPFADVKYFNFTSHHYI